MPIPVEELERAQRPLEERILEFLHGNRDNAYTMLEIRAQLEGYDSSVLAFLEVLGGASEEQAIAARYLEALATLKQKSAIRSADHQGVTYYAAVKQT